MDFIKSIFKKKEVEKIETSSEEVILEEITLEELQEKQKKLREEFFSNYERTEQEKDDFHAKDGELCVLINQFKK